jgi:hypothetical protein
MRFIGVIIVAYLLGTNAQAALTPDLDKEITRFIQSSPTVNGLRVQPELVDPNITVPGLGRVFGVEQPFNCGAPRQVGW